MEKYLNYIISSTCMIISAIMFASIILKQKPIIFRINTIIFVLLSTLIYGLLLYHFNGSTKTLLLCVIYIFLFKLLFNIETYKSIMIVFLYTISTIIPDSLYMLFLIYILKIPKDICYSKYAGSISSTIIVSILLVLITLIFRKILRKINAINNNIAIIICTILTLGSIIFLFYKSFWYIKFNENLLISILIMMSFILILFNLIKQKLENNKMINKYDKLLEFIKKYEVEIDEQKMIRHENKNQLITIRDDLENNRGNKEIIDYINSILKDYKTYNEDKYGKYQYLPSNGIKGLFYYKSMEAEEKNINLSINVSSKIENSIIGKLNTNDFKQLCRLIGIYLDNAIYASSESLNKKMGIEIYAHNKDVIIIISNTYSGKIDNEKIGKVKYTTKGQSHGYGLMMANKILLENKIIFGETKITNDLYIQKIIIKNSID